MTPDYDVAVGVVTVVVAVAEFTVALTKPESGPIVTIAVIPVLAIYIDADFARIREGRNDSRNRCRSRQSASELSHHCSPSSNGETTSAAVRGCRNRGGTFLNACSSGNVSGALAAAWRSRLRPAQLVACEVTQEAARCQILRGRAGHDIDLRSISCAD